MYIYIYIYKEQTIQNGRKEYTANSEDLQPKKQGHSKIIIPKIKDTYAYI